ncbi:MAG: hypothetical protein LW832_06945 [Parachlamydia sp.]|jgi:hypothetical protein|nr:hypothetical protein [Parachlamydia sp.]
MVAHIPNSQAVIDNWSSERKISKQAGVGIGGHLLRAVGLVAGLAVYVLLGIVSVIYQGMAQLREKYLATYRPNHVTPAIRQMKAQEEFDKFQTMQQVIKDFPAIQTLITKDAAHELTKDLKQKLESSETVQNKGARLILRMMGSKDSFNPIWLKAIKDPEIIASLSFSNIGIAPQAFIETICRKYPDLQMDAHTIDWALVSKKALKNKLSGKRIEVEVAKYQKTIEALLTQLNSSGTSPATQNPQFIAALRQALNSPVYQAIKEDTTDQSVKLLHRFAVDMWNRAPSMEAYSKLGSCILQEASFGSDNQEKSGVKLAEKLAKSHAMMEQQHYSAHGLANFPYALAHPKQALGALASEGGAVRHIPGMFGMDVYDSHGTLANNPSLQGVTPIMQGDQQIAKVHNCYGGSPTIGDNEIAPEMKAAIQAAENNQMAAPQDRDDKVPMLVVYNNLQNLDKSGGEGPRSHSIMLLNKKYPLSFRGTTFAKDSRLYLMHKAEDVVWTGPAQFASILNNQLLRSFDPAEKGHGFYFHGGPEKWAPLFDASLNAAVVHFDAMARQDPEHYASFSAKELQGAFQEYVYSLLNTANELNAAETIAGRGIFGFLIMAITACKENIDRGGMENTKYLYTRLTDAMPSKEWEEMIMGAMHSRALSARDRIILSARLPQILAFMKTNQPGQFRQEMAQATSDMGFQLSLGDFQPFV